MRLGKKRTPDVLPPRATWILVANRTGAVIFRKIDGEQIDFLKRYENPNGRARELQLVSDRPGQVHSNGPGLFRHSLGKSRVWHEHGASTFARGLMNDIAKANSEGRFDDLILMAEPHFLGLLRKQLPSSLQKTARLEICRELKFISTKRVENCLKHAS